ncbi:MAG TPA: hypothetical protein VH740_20635 [Vicinamibacterales bacterium]|jgi:hypothetical protein
MVLTENDQPKVQPRQDEVTFAKRGDTYVLQEIWDSALSVGVEPTSMAAHGAKAHAKTHKP